MTSLNPPAADDEDAYIFIDNHEEPGVIIPQVSRRLAPEHALTARVADNVDHLFVAFRGQEHRIPLTLAWYDQYVEVSSLAELLQDDYRFFVLAPTLDSDTHGVLVVPVAIARAWVPLPDHLIPLQLGFDYFGKIKVPYLNHEDSAPDFARESGAANEMHSALGQLFSGFLAGKADPDTSAALAGAVVTHLGFDKLADMPDNLSKAEMAAEIQKAMEELLRDPELTEGRREIDAALQELRKLTGEPPERPD
jgi:hypothetical protein